ncbi:hypothetical protein HYFRA_00009565 [Hymenoscyphus fraxineus]|uniref:Cell wall anchored protein n=1 Tax=Hymenoscyphus fraxineus TaxID=746836 RepID=A0A9N9PQC0_9HELO|nr:hypothetical protein HYFRA_00009565 [Hymenoscyphus fraxineus]
MVSTILGLMLVSMEVVMAQKNPKTDFCRRFGHQTAVVDKKLFLDGGQVNYNSIQENPTNVTNTFLSYHDLTTSPKGIEMPELFANLSKNASIPSLSGGSLWADAVNKYFYLFGGENYASLPTSPQDVYRYDIINDHWNTMGPPNSDIKSVSWGAGVGASSIGSGFVYGGWLSNLSVAGWTGPPMATNSLIKYDMERNTWFNITGPDKTGRAEGAMVYVPASDDGLLVHFGGVDVGPNGTQTPNPMNTIRIYDIRSTKWYNQTATGDVPPNRKRFCADSAWSADRTSYNIYLYGGLGFGDNGPGFDDMWILSLPSFQWINYYKSPAGAVSPHHSLSCNVVGGGQMLVIGGTFPITDSCDSPQTWGVHNADLGKVSGKAWNTYDPNITSYRVPPEVINVIGGSQLGGAKTTRPPNGWNAELEVYFQQNGSSTTRVPTRELPSDKKGSSGIKLAPGAIAGIAIGGALLVASLIVGICFCIRRKKHRNQIQIGSPRPQPITKALPQVPKEHFSPQSQHSHPYRQKPAPQSQHELITEPEPVELYGSHYRMTTGYTKDEGLGMQKLEEAQADAPAPLYYSRSPPPPPPPPSSEPPALAPAPAASPNPSMYSTRWGRGRDLSGWGVR